MPLENINTGIEDLDETAPVDADLLSETDDHIRNIKQALKLSFTSVATTPGVVTASATELNYLAGVTGNVQAQIDAKAERLWTFPLSDTQDATTETWLLQPNTKIMLRFTTAATIMRCTVPAIAAGSDGDAIIIRPAELDNVTGFNFQIDAPGIESFRSLDTLGNWGTFSNLNFQIPPWPQVLCIFSAHFGRWVVRPFDALPTQAV